MDRYTYIKWQGEIDAYQDKLVGMAEETMSDNRIERLSDASTQLSLFQQAAQETNSVAVLVNWIQYQMGRKGIWKGENNNFGEDVLHAIKEMASLAKQIAANVYGENPDAKTIQQTHLALIRLYAGYTRRWYVAKGGGEDDNRN